MKKKLHCNEHDNSNLNLGISTDLSQNYFQPYLSVLESKTKTCIFCVTLTTVVSKINVIKCIFCVLKFYFAIILAKKLSNRFKKPVDLL